MEVLVGQLVCLSLFPKMAGSYTSMLLSEQLFLHVYCLCKRYQETTKILLQFLVFISLIYYITLHTYILTFLLYSLYLGSVQRGCCNLISYVTRELVRLTYTILLRTQGEKGVITPPEHLRGE